MKPCGLACFQEAHHNGFPLTDLALLHWRRRWRLLPSRTAIHALIVGENDETMALSAALAGEGILVPAIRPPTVPKGSARLRISLSAAHTLTDVDLLIDALDRAEAMWS